MKLDVVNLDNNKVGDIEVSPSIFGVPLHQDLIKRYVVYQNAKKQSGNHKVKTLNEVNATGKKPFKQKGTGNARLGSKKAPQCRGGAVIFGPVVRSHEISLPKKVRKLAIKSVLSQKLSSNKLVVINNMDFDKPKTSLMLEKIKNFNSESLLFIFHNSIDINFLLSIRNIPKVNVLSDSGVNVYDILKHDLIIIAEDSIRFLERGLQ